MVSCPLMLIDLMHLLIDYKPILTVTVSLSTEMIWTHANLSLEMNIHFPRMCFYLGARISLTQLCCNIRKPCGSSRSYDSR